MKGGFGSFSCLASFQPNRGWLFSVACLFAPEEAASPSARDDLLRFLSSAIVELEVGSLP